jgi:DNA-binding winged helix-turn-helix (wHTH) protein/tetratricopeptide (TPR) repeat protein
MGCVSTRPPVYQFAEFELDTAQRQLRRNGQLVSLTPKQFATLELLVLSSGRTLTKEEMLSALWPDSFVEEGNLTQNIFQLRKVLGQTPDHIYIVTEAGVGYRFVAEVVTVRPAAATSGLLEAAVAPAEKPAAPVTPDVRAASPRSNHRVIRVAAVFAVLLIFAAAGVVLWRRSHHPSIGSQPHRVVLADFSNLTREKDLGSTLQAALRISLEQSPYFNVLSEHAVSQTLQAMQRSPDEPLTDLSVAGEVCERDGQSSIVRGSVVGVGSAYQLALEARDCKSQRVIAAAKAAPASVEGLLPALDILINKLRLQLGEPHWSSTIDPNGKYTASSTPQDQLDAPIEQATTHSMEALKAFVQGDYFRSHNDTFQAIPLYERAIEVDPGFAMAYARLGVAYLLLNEERTAKQYFQRAHDLSTPQLSLRERLYIQTHYTTTVTGDLNNTIATYLTWTNSFPEDSHPWINLSSDCYTPTGQYPKAMEAGRNAVRLAPFQGNAYIALATAALRGNNVTEARAVCDRTVAAHLDGWDIHDVLFRIAALNNDANGLAAQAAWAHGRPIEYAVIYDQAWLALRDGKVQQSMKLFNEARSLATAQHLLQLVADQSVLRAMAMQDYGYMPQARALMATQTAPATPALLAYAWARMGDTERARKLAAQLSHDYPNNTVINSYELPEINAQIQLDEHNLDQATEILRATHDMQLSDYSALMLATEINQAAGRPEASLSAFETILANPGVDPLSPKLPLAQLGLARALAASHQIAAAGDAYKKVMIMWRDADPDLPPLQAATKEFAALGHGASAAAR